MSKVLKLLVAISVALQSFVAFSQNIDVSRAEFLPDGGDAFVLKGFQMPGNTIGGHEGILKGRFSWSNEKKAFFLEPASVEKIGSVGGGACRAASMEGPGANTFTFVTNPVSEGEYAGFKENVGLKDLEFTASWFKGALSMNPFLSSRNTANLVNGNAYGVVGSVSNRYKGFFTGQLVEVSGSIEGGGFQVKALDTGAVAVFSNRSRKFWKITDCNIVSGTYYGEYSNEYSIQVNDKSSGGLRSMSPVYHFDAAWNKSAQKSPNVLLGLVGNVNPITSAIRPGDRVFVLPLGAGLALAALGPDGVVKTSAVFIQRLSQ